MSHWDTVNSIIRVVIPAFLTLVIGEFVLWYYEVTEISSSIVSCEIAFGIILLFGSILFYTAFIMRKLSEVLIIESIKKRPFRELYTSRQTEIWNDISSKILQQGKKCVPFGIGFLRSASFLERKFKRDMVDIKRRLNTKYKNIVEDEISGIDAILIAAHKSYEEDIEHYYNEKIFNKDNKLEKYGTALRLNPIAETTKFEKYEKRRGQIYSALTTFLIVIFVSSSFYSWSIK